MKNNHALIKNSGLFNETWYLAEYPDVEALGIDPVQHYLSIGARLGRRPSVGFDTKFYLSKYPDVADTGINPLVHYLRYGRKEGRSPFNTNHFFSGDNGPLSELENSSGSFQKPDSGGVIFISGESADRPGYTYRIARYADAFTKIGIKATCIIWNDIERHWSSIASARLIIIWRAAWNNDIERVIEISKKRNIPTIFDVDDLMVRSELAVPEYIDAIRYDRRDPKSVQDHFDRITRTMLNCDLGTATTEELAWQMRFVARGKSVFVLPNGFGSDTYQFSRVHARIKAKNPDGLIRIGYASGSRTHQKDFQVCAEGVARVLRENKTARLVLFKRGDLVTLDVAEFPCLAGLEEQIEWRPFVSHSDLPKEIARFDINLAPLDHGNPFVEAKSELKFFEAAIADVVTIASPTAPFERCIRHGETGFLAETPQEWSDLIDLLVNNAEIRRIVAREAHRWCLWHFGPTRRVDLAKSMIDLVKGGRDSARAFRSYATASAPSNVPLADREIVFEAFKDKPSRVSVIVPLHNYQDYIAEALESIASQSMNDLDLIVVDDKSTDGSQEIALQWIMSNQSRFNRVVLAQHLKNSGLGASRNTAFDLSDTLHIMALDADNKLRPDCCEKLLRALDHEGAAFSYSIVQHFGDSTETIGMRPFSPGDFVAGNQVDAMAMISKEAWALVGGYATHRLGWQDFDLWCRFLDHGLHGVHVPEILADYRVHQKSMLRTATDKARNKSQLLDLMEETHPWLALIDGRDGYRLVGSKT